MRAHGIGAGDRIALATAADVELAPVLLACLRLGVALLPISPEATGVEAQALLAPAAPSLLIADEAVLATWRLDTPAATWTIRARRGWFAKKAPADLDAKLAAVSPIADLPETVDADRDLLLLATSGSSGTPKLVRLTVMNLVAQAETFERELGFDATARVLNLSPAVHVDGVTGIFAALWSGSTLVRPGRFSVDRLPEVLHAFYRYRVTHALVVPTMLQLLARLADDLRAGLATGDLRLLVSTAAPLPDALWAEIEARTGIPVVDMFGLTETGNVLFTRPGEAMHRGTLGRPVDCEARLVVEGVVLNGPGEGELEVAGPSVSPGYLGAPRESAWFATGDLLARDADGIFRLVGRKKNVIITGGRNVSPEEVDAALASHPGVLEAITVGLPDDIWGERVESCVVPRDPAVDLDEVARHAASRLSPYKQPRALHRRASLPRGPSGKPLRHVVRDELLASGGVATTTRHLAPLDERVLVLAAEVFRVPVTALSRTSAPGAPRTWDSLAHLQLVTRLEEAFDVELAPREITRIDSLARAIDLIAEKLDRGR